MVPGGYTDDNFYRARKEIVHSFRYLLFAVQIIQHGRIIDFSAANQFLSIIMSIEMREKNWDDIVKIFKVHFEDLKQQLKDLRNYAHFYSRIETERMFFDHLKQRKYSLELYNTYINQDGGSDKLTQHDSQLLKYRNQPCDYHMTLKTLEFLHSFPGSSEQALVALQQTYHIITCRHSCHPNLVLLRHDVSLSLPTLCDIVVLTISFIVKPYSIASWTDSAIAQECQGLIVDISDHFRVVALPFPKFFSYCHPEGKRALEAIRHNWETSEEKVSVVEHIDGTSAGMKTF